jgi:hypothetical protein
MAWMAHVLFLAGTTATPLLYINQTGSGAQWVLISEEVKWPGHEADHSSPSTAEAKNAGALPPLSHTFSWHGVQLITLSVYLYSKIIDFNSKPTDTINLSKTKYRHYKHNITSSSKLRLSFRVSVSCIIRGFSKFLTHCSGTWAAHFENILSSSSSKHFLSPL